MDLQFLQLQLNLQQLQNLTRSMPSFELGRVVSATVGQNQNGFTLLMKGLEIPIKTDLPLVKGETLQLKVSEIGQSVILKLQHPPQLAGGQINRSQAAIQNAIRQAIPKQDTYAPLLSNLNHIGKQPPQISAGGARELANQFIQQLPTANQASTPQGLKNVVQNSGIFLEAKLAKIHHPQNNPGAQSTVQNDIKANLLKLQASIQKLISQNQATTPSPDSEIKQSSARDATNNPNQPPSNQAQAARQDTALTKALITQPGKEPPPLLSTQAAKGEQATPEKAPPTSLLQNLAGEKALSTATTGQANTPFTPTPPVPGQPNIPTGGTTSTSTSQNQEPANQAQQNATSRTSQTIGTELSSHKTASQIPTKGQFPAPQASMPPTVDPNDALMTQQKINTQIESALSRIHLNQVASLPQPEGNIQQAFLMEVPIRNENRTDVLQMAIEEREAKDPFKEGKEHFWNVNFAIELEHLGALQASVQIAGKSLQINLWSEDRNSHYLVQSEMSDLKKELEKHGFDIETLAAYPGLNDTLSFQRIQSLIDAKI